MLETRIRSCYINENLVDIIEEKGYRVEWCGHTKTIYVYDSENKVMIYQKFGFSPCMGGNFIKDIDELSIIAITIQKAWYRILI